MRDDFNIQFSSQHLLEDIEETSTTSGVGTYQRKTPMAEKDTYKKHKGERTTGGEIYKNLWEEEDLQSGDRIYVTYPNEFKGEKGEIVGVYNGFVTVKIDGETGIHSMHISHVNKVDSTDSTEDVDEGLNELFTREDYQKALDLLKKLETTNPKIYKAIKKIVLSAAVDPYNSTTYSDLETMANKGALAENEKKERVIRIIGQQKFQDLYSMGVKAAEQGKTISDNPNKGTPNIASKEAWDMGYNSVNKKTLAENYSKFKNETKTRSKPDQFHQAVREVKKRVHEINKVFEYVNRLKSELNESGELKYRRHTEAAMSKIKEMVNELNSKIKKFK
jgi:hypothetical protein